MPQIQIKLNPKEDSIVAIYKIRHNLKTKQQAIKQIIQNQEKKERGV